jgi:hypothetical protein
MTMSMNVELHNAITICNQTLWISEGVALLAGNAAYRLHYTLDATKVCRLFVLTNYCVNTQTSLYILI